MTFYVDNAVSAQFPFDVSKAATAVIEEALKEENCPYEVEVNILITDNAGIQDYNKEYRNIDKPTDVLSFPNVDYKTPADFSVVEVDEADYFEPDTGELVLGDIILCNDRITAQAEEYGHSLLREFSFLIAHSMLHLLGYDHMTEGEAGVMEAKQNLILDNLGIKRER